MVLSTGFALILGEKIVQKSLFFEKWWKMARIMRIGSGKMAKRQKEKGPRSIRRSFRRRRWRFVRNGAQGRTRNVERVVVPKQRDAPLKPVLRRYKPTGALYKDSIQRGPAHQNPSSEAAPDSCARNSPKAAREVCCWTTATRRAPEYGFMKFQFNGGRPKRHAKR
jgi:hypothetical protein